VPISHFVDRSNRVVVTTCSGELSRDEVIKSLIDLRKHPSFEPDFSQLSDLSQVSRLNLSYADLETIRSLYDPFSIQSRRAVAAPGSDSNYGVARMYEALVDQERFQVFRSLLDAISWLGLEVTILHPARKKDGADKTAKRRGKGSTG
jgi:hypothetical protein